MCCTYIALAMITSELSFLQDAMTRATEERNKAIADHVGGLEADGDDDWIAIYTAPRISLATCGLRSRNFGSSKFPRSLRFWGLS